MSQQTQPTTTIQALRSPAEVSMPAVNLGFFDLQGFELLQRVSKAFSTSDLVPKQYHGNMANCMIALDMAQRIGANPLMVMQNLYIVHGTPGWSSKFLIATINVCGRFNALRYEWRGKPGDTDYGCRAWTIERSTGERLDGIWVDWKMVKAEGWSSKNGSKWNTMPDQMFIYRSAAFWQRAYAPELGMGLQTSEELHDVIDATPTTDGTIQVDVDALRRGTSSGAQQTQGEQRQPEQRGRARRTAQQPVTDVDLDTGEVKQALADTAPNESAATHPAQSTVTASKSVAVTFDQVAASIRNATTLDALDLAADQIRDVLNDDERGDLDFLYGERRNEIEAASATATPANAPAARRGRGQMNLD